MAKVKFWEISVPLTCKEWAMIGNQLLRCLRHCRFGMLPNQTSFLVTINFFLSFIEMWERWLLSSWQYFPECHAAQSDHMTDCPKRRDFSGKNGCRSWVTAFPSSHFLFPGAGMQMCKGTQQQSWGRSGVWEYRGERWLYGTAPPTCPGLPSTTALCPEEK